MLNLVVGLLPLLVLVAENVRAGKLSLTDTITWGGDNSRTGYQPFRTHNMDPSVVSSPQFGQLWKAVLPGSYRDNAEQIYSQPLIYTLDDDVQYVFVSTTQNNIYKINAKTGSIVASRNLHVPFLTADLDGCVDINPTIGITGTGVIDPDTDTWYLTAKTYQDQTDHTKGRLNGRYYFHAINVNTLVERPGFPKGLEGVLGSNNANRMFQSGNAHQRPALLHTGQYVYAGFASHCVQYNFTGWIMGWDKISGELVEHFTTEAGPEKATVSGGGIWMSGGGIATDGKGSMYFSTGNGYASQLSGIPVPGRQPPTALEEAVVNVKINDNGSVKVVDFFMPWEKVQLDGADKDLGTTPFELLQPDVFTCPKVKRMGVVIGKSGKMYILNLDNLGGYQQGPNKLDAVPQVLQNENSVYAGAGIYPLEGGYIYVNVIQYPTHVFKFSCDASGNPSFIKVADSPEKNAYVLGVGHGTTTSLNGQAGTGLLWVSDVDGYNLRVYNAIPVDGKLQLIKTANIPGITKFSRPVFGDGRAYLGTTQGTLYCFGSPVNLPITCTSPTDFGIVSINNTSVTKSIHCQAHVSTRINTITIASSNFRISLLPILPVSIDQGQNISFSAVFTPSAPGSLSNDIVLAVTNNADGYAPTVPISLKGIGASQAPLLAVTPNVVSFEGVILGQQAGGLSQSIIFANQGDEILHINSQTNIVTSLEYSIVSETGAPVTPSNTAEGLQVGPFTFKSLPTTIPRNSQVIVNINFNPANTGNFAVYVHVHTDGGTKIFDVVGTAGTFAVALLEFQAADGSGKWIQYANNSPPFTFGDVFEQQTKICKLRVTNKGSNSASSLSITVSKPPFGVAGIIGAQNGVDLGEGTNIGAGQSDTADLFCSVPKSQVNVDSYNATAVWIMNTGDPNFGKQFIQFTCNAVTRQVGPLDAIDGSAIYRYTGCWKENNPGRQMRVQLWGKDPENTNGKCISACAARNYVYAGTQYVDECWCSNKLPNKRVDETECNYGCSGDESETCGGNGYFHDGSFISVFTKTPSAINTTEPALRDPAVLQLIDNYNYAGCYTEGSNGRALGASSNTSENMTVENCAAFCKGFKYFGIEYASECYCDDLVRAGSVKIGETECSMTCSGNDSEICGAGNRLTLYTMIGNQSGYSSSLSATISLSPTASLTPPASSSTPSGPVVVSTAGTFVYQGCYTEGTNTRALSATTIASANMSVESCATFCAGYSYMGVEYSSECYCANNISDGAIITSTGCSMTCSGNSNEYCGGPSRLNLYTVGGTPPSSAILLPTTSQATLVSSSNIASTTSSTSILTVTTAGSFTYQGCYTEGKNARALSTASTASWDMTVEKCAVFCIGYSYMGVEYSTECFCANSISDGAVLTPSGCSMTCGGNSNEYCGGPNRLNLYKTDPGKPTSASTTSSMSISPISSAPTRSSKTATGPVAFPTASLFTYQGCYTEGTSTRALSAVSTAGGDMTVEKCATFCNGYSYMGTEYSSECYCGNSISDGAVLASSGCFMACAGNQDEYCGGPNRLSFYKANSSSSAAAAASDGTIKVSSTPGTSPLSITSTTAQPVTSSNVASTPSLPSATAPSIVQSNANFTYTACYIDSGPRTLTKLILANDRMTVEICLQACSEYNYVGLEYGRECWCDNVLLSSASLSADERECNMPCAGSSVEICGNGNRLSLYTHKSQVRPVAANFNVLRIPIAASTVGFSSSIVVASGNSNKSSISTIRAYLATISPSRISPDIPTNTTLTRPRSSTPSISTENSLRLSRFTERTHPNPSTSTSLTTELISSSLSSNYSTFSTSHKHTRTITLTSISRLTTFSSNRHSRSIDSTATVRSPTISKDTPPSIGRFTLPTSSTPFMGTRTSISNGKARISSHTPGTPQSKGKSASSSPTQGIPLSKYYRSNSALSPLVGISTTYFAGKPSSSFSTVGLVNSSLSTDKSTSSSSKTDSSFTTSATFLAPPRFSTSVSSGFFSSTQRSSSQSNRSSTATTATASKTFSFTTFTTTSASNPSSSEPPSQIPSQIDKNGWTYLGCVNQTSPIALSGIRRTFPADTLSVESCQSLCLKNYYGIAGLENGSICSCGNGLQSYSSSLGHLESACNTRCNGNSSEVCGGLNPSTGQTYLSVWNSTSTAVIPTFVHQVGAYPRVGCFRNININTTTASYPGPLAISVESCVSFCISSSNQPYAYLKDGRTCYCAATLPASASLWDDVRCTKTCAGNSREFCGGIEGVLVYGREDGSVVNGVPKGVNADNTPLG